ncbi:SDR family oxidoreductase [Streptomyces sp. Y7]|uniref:SDR family oxidoreductase n=1 Tax=Streptomyces sp. Y7 TaxID=3342392 RepID=UPI0037239B06
MSHSLAGARILMSGGSRGIGRAIALRCARDGARVALLAKTDRPHPVLPGTVHTVVEEIEAAGGQGLAIVGDVRQDEAVARAVAATVDAFGGIDIVVNNASAIDLSRSPDLTMKKLDLLLDVEIRGTFGLTKAALPHLIEGNNPQVLTLSPPISDDVAWYGRHLGYTIAKFGMSMCTIGFAEELREHGVAANSLWPRTLIATAAVENVVGGGDSLRRARTPEIMADAAHVILTQESCECTGRFFVDDEVLWDAGVRDLSGYRAFPGSGEELEVDLFLPREPVVDVRD